MRTFYLCLTALVISTFVSAQEALFNGKNFDGWYAFEPSVGKVKGEDLFKIDSGMIRMYGEKSAYLVTEKSYENFELTLQFRWNTDASLPRRIQVKNSGVMYLVPEETPDELWPKGIQFQVKEGHTGDFILIKETTLVHKGKNIEPGKSVVVEKCQAAEKPIGEWNTLTIRVRNGKITQKLNGKTVNKGKKASIHKGRILLQYEGYPIDFRNLEIRELKSCFLGWW